MIRCQWDLVLITFGNSGLFTVPTRIVFIVAPINVLLNWLLGNQSSKKLDSGSGAKFPIK